MDKHQRLSKSQRLVMDVVWKLGEVNNALILKELSGVRDWSRHTVKTYLKQLVEKGFLEERRVSTRKYFYYPLISKDDYLADGASYYLQKNYDGLSFMVAGLVERERVSSDEIEKLEEIIREFKRRKDD